MKNLFLNQIEELFYRDSENCFDDDNKSDFRVMLRIAVDFHEYLAVTDPQRPDPEEVEYMVDTIRSGIDSFFAFKNYFRVWSNQGDDGDRWRSYADFATLKSEYIHLFQRMKNEELSFNDRMHSLFLLIGMGLQFLTAKW